MISMMIRTLLIILAVGVMRQSAFAGTPPVPAVEEQLSAKAETAKNRRRKIDAYLELAQWSKDNGRGETALESYEKAIDLSPGRKKAFQAFLDMGDIHFTSQKYAWAIAAYKQAIGLYDKKDVGRLKLALVYEHSDLPLLARQEYLIVLKNTPRSFEANFGIARLYLGQGLNNLAMEYFRRALLIKPERQVYTHIAQCAENRGDSGLAVAMLQQAFSMCGDFETALSLGRLYQRMGKAKEAEEYFSKAVMFDADRIETYVYLGLISLEKNELAQAEKLFQIAGEKQPREGMVHYLLAELYHKQQRPALAAKELKKAQELSKSVMLESYSRKFAGILALPAAQ